MRALGLAELTRNLRLLLPNRQLNTWTVRGTRVFVFVASFFVSICTFILGKQVNWVRGIRGRVVGIRRGTLLIPPLELAPLDEVLCQTCPQVASVKAIFNLY